MSQQHEIVLTVRAKQTYESGKGGTVHVRFADNVGRIMDGEKCVGEVSSLIGGSIEIERDGRRYTVDALDIWQAFEAAAEASAVSPEGAQESAERTLRSIAAMLGWVNLPPRETLEAEIRALKARAASLSPSPTTSEPTRTKGIYIGAPACFALEEAIRPVCEAFNCYQGKGIRGCYVVGSALQRPDWRDVDVRLMLDDDSFAEVFPDAGQHWEHDARWLCLTVAISERLSRLTGLPIDFQFQPMTHANERHKGRRNAIGLRITSEPSVGAQGDGTERPA